MHEGSQACRSCDLTPPLPSLLRATTALEKSSATLNSSSELRRPIDESFGSRVLSFGALILFPLNYTKRFDYVRIGEPSTGERGRRRDRR
ncbi:hypothetical protein CEXT_758001 [Caerostris extrusa]|uniref:Uncharacterized protein n=1 Tax=Caerostris extrusa TaxID=172846 RepID=A0AAV4U7G0_CAEEX|nr:hypothetical protein CEXT_758001 [Caerostris extrusa]